VCPVCKINENMCGWGFCYADTDIIQFSGDSQVLQDDDGRHYFVSCTNVLGSGTKLLDNFKLSSSQPLGECISLCRDYAGPWSADPCTYGEVVGEWCSLSADAVYANDRE